jgi:hypothetical protein
MAGNIVDWARSLVTSIDSDQVKARHSYGFSAMPADSVRVVTDSVACARAGRAYLAGERPLPGRHRVVLVSVGDRYIALDLNQMGRAGEFMTEAILDRRFRLLSWLMT